MKALLIIDMQLDFMPGGALAVPKADELIPVVNRLQTQFELVVATQDWHPEGHMSFIPTGPWPRHCVQGTQGAMLHPELHTHQIAAIIRKGMDKNRDCYSAFYDTEHEKGTGLAEFLRAYGVTQIHFCGLCADVCVYFSIVDAFQAGFECVLIDDATIAVDESDFQKKRNSLLQKGVKCMLSSDSLV